MIYRNQNNNQREPGTPYVRNAAKTQFERTMKREGRIVVTYTSGTEFRAFFRTRDEHENQRESVIMYYDVTAPVRPGTLVMVGYGVFLTLNRETTENDIYYKSTMIRCNGVFNENTGIVHNVPFYAGNLKSSVSIGNSTISMLNGNIEAITEENTLSKQIEIDQYFNEFGRTFRVTNKYTMDGIVHIIAEVEADQETDFVDTSQIDKLPDSPTEETTEPTYNYKISGNTNLKFGYTRTYTLYITDENGNAIENVDFIWNVVSDFAVEQTINGNQIKLRVKDDENLIGNTFLLQVIVEETVKAEISIKVVELM
ncbi:MAG: hypothetical protein HFI45_18315 [Lachnospiraceae bacterium]|nr:hypothetical protein [Lachnospiraceae bacterium]